MKATVGVRNSMTLNNPCPACGESDALLLNFNITPISRGPFDPERLGLAVCECGEAVTLMSIPGGTDVEQMFADRSLSKKAECSLVDFDNPLFPGISNPKDILRLVTSITGEFGGVMGLSPPNGAGINIHSVGRLFGDINLRDAAPTFDHLEIEGSLGLSPWLVERAFREFIELAHVAEGSVPGDYQSYIAVEVDGQWGAATGGIVPSEGDAGMAPFVDISTDRGDLFDVTFDLADEQGEPRHVTKLITMEWGYMCGDCRQPTGKFHPHDNHEDEHLRICEIGVSVFPGNGPGFLAGPSHFHSAVVVMPGLDSHHLEEPRATLLGITPNSSQQIHGILLDGMRTVSDIKRKNAEQ